MKKSLIFSIVLILSSLFINAQECDRYEIEKISDEDTEDIIPIIKTPFGVFRKDYSEDTYSLYPVDDLLGINVGIDLDLNIDGVQHEYAATLILNERMYVITSSNEEEFLYATEYKNEISDFGDTKLIFENKIGNKESEIQVSENNRFILIQSKLIDNKEKKWGTQFMVLNEDLEVVNENQIINKGKGLTCIGIWDTHITNSGAVLVTTGTRSFSNPVFRKKGIKLTIYPTFNGEPVAYTDLPLAPVYNNSFQYSGSVDFYVDYPNGDFAIFYASLKDSETGKMGLKETRFSGESFKILSNLWRPYYKDTQLYQVEEEKKAKLDKSIESGKVIKPTSGLKLVNILVNSDGSSFLVYQKSLTKSTETSVSYESGDILVIKVDRSYNKIWSTTIEAKLKANTGYMLNLGLEVVESGDLLITYTIGKNTVKIMNSLLDLENGRIETCELLSYELGKNEYVVNVPKYLGDKMHLVVIHKDLKEEYLITF